MMFRGYYRVGLPLKKISLRMATKTYLCHNLNSLCQDPVCCQFHILLFKDFMLFFTIYSLLDFCHIKKVFLKLYVKNSCLYLGHKAIQLGRLPGRETIH